MAGKGYKILLVDDDRFLIDMYSMKFRENGHEVIPAFGGADALTKLREGLSPDIIVFDIVMPGVDGFELLETIKKEKLAGKAVKIALTNQGQSSDVDRAKGLGAVGYIIKASAIPSEVLTQVCDIAGAHRTK